MSYLFNANKQQLSDDEDDPNVAWLSDWTEWCNYQISKNHCESKKIVLAENSSFFVLYNLFNKFLLEASQTNVNFVLVYDKKKEQFQTLTHLKGFFTKTAKDNVAYILEEGAKRFITTIGEDWNNYVRLNKDVYNRTRLRIKNYWYLPVDAFVFGFTLYDKEIEEKGSVPQTIMPNSNSPVMAPAPNSSNSSNSSNSNNSNIKTNPFRVANATPVAKKRSKTSVFLAKLGKAANLLKTKLKSAMKDKKSFQKNTRVYDNPISINANNEISVFDVDEIDNYMNNNPLFDNNTDWKLKGFELDRNGMIVDKDIEEAEERDRQQIYRKHYDGFIKNLPNRGGSASTKMTSSNKGTRKVASKPVQKRVLAKDAKKTQTTSKRITKLPATKSKINETSTKKKSVTSKNEKVKSKTPSRKITKVNTESI